MKSRPSTFAGAPDRTGRGCAWAAVAVGAVCACATGQQTVTAPVGASPVTVAKAPPPLVPFHGEGGFTVLMPPKPDQSARTESTPAGTVQVHLAEVRDESAKYLASATDFPPGSLVRIPRKELLDSLQQSTVRSMNGTLVSSTDVDVAGMPGREFTATDPRGSEVTARIFVGDSRVYTLAGTYPRGAVPSQIRQFLDSFRLPPATLPAVPGTGAGTPSGAGPGPGSAREPKDRASR